MSATSPPAAHVHLGYRTSSSASSALPATATAGPTSPALSSITNGNGNGYHRQSYPPFPSPPPSSSSNGYDSYPHHPHHHSYTAHSTHPSPHTFAISTNATSSSVPSSPFPFSPPLSPTPIPSLSSSSSTTSRRVLIQTAAAAASASPSASSSSPTSFTTTLSTASTNNAPHIMLNKPRFAHQSVLSSPWLYVSIAINVILLVLIAVLSMQVNTVCPSSSSVSPSALSPDSPFSAFKASYPPAAGLVSQRLYDADTETAASKHSSAAASLDGSDAASTHRNAATDNGVVSLDESNVAAAAHVARAAFGAADDSGVRSWTQVPTVDLQVDKDLSDDADFTIAQHAHTWKYCPSVSADYMSTPLEYCAEEANVEQKWQMSWFGLHVVPGTVRPFPKFLSCVHLPPTGYTWPAKQTSLPAVEDAVRWQNLRVQSRAELVVFNQATPKNLYHFDAVRYDLDAMTEIKFAARYIPFGPKVRLMLDVGAGGGSLGLLLKRKYDTQVLSTVFADWPYCEYITERGGLCMLVDVMEPMPFAKFTFDVLHVSWVYHGQQPSELFTMFSELNRVLRPGGYLWMRGGWSTRQITMLKDFLINKLGYTALFDRVAPKPAQVTERISFGPDLPYNADWDCVLVKPTVAQLASTTECAAAAPVAVQVPAAAKPVGAVAAAAKDAAPAKLD